MNKINKILLSLPLCLFLFSCGKKTTISTTKDLTTNTKVVTKKNKTTKTNVNTSTNITTNKITTKKVTTKKKTTVVKTTTEHIIPTIKTTENDRQFKYEIVKDLDNNVLQVVRSYKNDSSNKYINYYKKDNKYNDNNKLIEECFSNYDLINEKWRYYEKNCYSYDENTVTIINYTYDSSINEFTIKTKVINEYLDNNLLGYYTIYSYTDGNFIPTYKFINTYYDDNRIQEIIKMKYDKTSKDFEYVEKDVFTYPDSTSKIDLFYVYENDSWTERNKYKDLYNSNGDIIAYYEYNKVGDGFQMYYSMYYTYEDDALLFKIESKLIDNTLTLTNKYVPQYDEKGYVCGYITYVMSDEEWKEYSKETYITDKFGLIVNNQLYTWNSETSSWVKIVII